MRDLLVAGGGPVGLATAVYAATAGMRVTVVEPRAGTLDKACGEGLMPSALRALAGLGVEVPGVPVAGIRYVAGSVVAESRFAAGPGLGARRTALHEALAARADALGVERLTARVGGVRQGDSWVEGAGLRARWLAAADGLHSPVRRCLGLDQPPRRVPRWGIRQHFAVRPWTDLVEVHWSPGAEAYVTPVTAELVGVAVLFSGRTGGGLAERLAGFPALQERLRGAPPVSAARGAGPLEQRVRRRVAGRVLLVGDAAGYVDALTGEGINLGIAGAAALVRCVQEGRPEDYEARWRRLTRRHRLITGALLRAGGRPVLRAGIVPAAARLPRIYAGLVDALA